MTRKKLIYLGFVMAAGGAFLVDRLFLGEPEAATAETVPAPAPKRRPHRSRELPPTEAQEAPDPSLTWLDQLAEGQAPRDVFSPSIGMLTYYQMLEEVQAERTGPKPGSPEAFQDQHQLEATFVSKEAMLAVVNGKVLRLGDIVDDFRLTRIEPYRVEFGRGRDRVSLSIPLPATPP